ncbi:PrsW family glutamic-type intramembrane protease [Chryseolinea sp. T2]|uniref:PrsW family intramembrane metalloprotease n=1 Tax=Chryseolinea sp. T2 TaxID=3129255 RepID=UPI003077B00D
MHVFALLSLAFAPGIAIALYVYLHDRHEREPLWLLTLSFAYGAFSTLLTLVFRAPVSLLIDYLGNVGVRDFVGAYFKIALIEEFSKFILLRFVLYYNRNFNESFDGIVYAIMVGMGFATAENLVYVYQYGLPTGVVRMFTAVPAHAVFAVLMGYFLGKAKFTHRHTMTYSVLALFSAALFHGSYDYFWFISFIPGIWIGALVSLILTFVLGRKAMRMHDQSRVFIDNENK